MAEESAITDALALAKSKIGAVTKPVPGASVLAPAQLLAKLEKTGDDDVVEERKIKSEVRPSEAPSSRKTKTEKSYFKGKKVPLSTSNASEYATTKAVAVVRGIDIARIIDLGLGRGIDSTNPTPWLSKSSFQVRPVTINNIIGTEEGGALQSYEREISSMWSQQVSLKASITIPQSPFTIGVDAEQSRNVTINRRAVGKKVVNRTVSFRADFEDAPSSSTTSGELARQQSLKSFPIHESTAVTFEERLCKWMLDRVRQREDLKLLEEGSPLSLTTMDLERPVDTLAEIIRTCTHDERKLIVKDCADFVHYFRITHYVSAVELGAAEYRVMSEQEYFSRIGAGGSFGLESVAAAAVSTKTSWKKTNKSSDLKRIGIVKPDGTVERGSYGEAVVGIQVQPISNLVKMRYLQLALQKALSDYVESQGKSSVGPFFIACNNDRIFLTVNPDNEYAVEGTKDLNQASEFYIIPREDSKHPYEFQIAYHGDVSGRFKLRRTSTLMSTYSRALGAVPRFLNASINTFGSNSGPLRMELNMPSADARLSLQCRVTTKQEHVETTPWVTGREIFYIRCTRRAFKMAGYLAIKMQTQRETRALYTTAAVSSIKQHNQINTFMLFRLLPTQVREMQKAATDTDDKPDLSDFEKLDTQLRKFSESKDLLGSGMPVLAQP